MTATTLATLEGYQKFTGENFQVMTNALTNIDCAQNITKILGNVKLIVQNNNNSYTEVSFKQTYNGADYTGMSFVFKNGQFCSFMDDRSQWIIGNTDVNISQTQAINIALQCAQNYSYTLDNGAVVKGFNVTRIEAGLNTYPRNNSTIIYPYWSVQLYLDKTYPGNVYGLTFGIWADSATVFLSQPLGVEGDLSANGAPTGTALQSQGQSGFSMLDISAIIVVLAAFIIGIVIVKKRNK